MELLKADKFQWIAEAQRSFESLKQHVTKASVLWLPDFSQVFEMECDALSMRIEAVLSQSGQPIAFFSEKLNDTRRVYYIYNKEFYAIMRALEYWSHYLLSYEFILFTDHKAFRFLSSQNKLQGRHTICIKFLSSFHFVLKHKAGVQNRVADDLSRRHIDLIA